MQFGLKVTMGSKPMTLVFIYLKQLSYSTGTARSKHLSIFKCLVQRNTPEHTYRYTSSFCESRLHHSRPYVLSPLTSISATDLLDILQVVIMAFQWILFQWLIITQGDAARFLPAAYRMNSSCCLTNVCQYVVQLLANTDQSDKSLTTLLRCPSGESDDDRFFKLTSILYRANEGYCTHTCVFRLWEFL